MAANDIQNVCFVGAGTMGCYNALVSALSGRNAILYDIAEDALAISGDRQRAFAAIMIANGYLTEELAEQAITRVHCTTDLNVATTDAHLVSESVAERLSVKRAIHATLDGICPPEAILTTNSSTLMVSQIEDVVQRGGKFAALHSHLLSPLVDIVGGPRTAPETIEALSAYVISTKSYPLLLKKENPGYVLNAIIRSLLGVSMRLVTERRIAFQDVDRAWISGADATMGPFGMIDMFGLNVIHDSLKHHDTRDSTQAKLISLIGGYVDGGNLGVKTGSGFYSYPEPEFRTPDFARAGDDTGTVYRTLVSTVISAGILVASKDVADPDAIDNAWAVGMFLSDGPFALLEKLGRDEFVGSLDDLVHMGVFSAEDVGIILPYVRGMS